MFHVLFLIDATFQKPYKKNGLEKLELEFQEYRRWQFDLMTLLKVINGNYINFSFR